METTLILHNARIYTVDDSRPWAQAAAIVDNKISAVGDNSAILDLAGPETELIDLGERLVLPGFCDAHIHLYDWSISLTQVVLAGSQSLEEFRSRIAYWSTEHAGARWITGRGWNETLWPQGRLPIKSDIDPITGDHRPALFWRSDMHCAVANSAALKRANIGPDTPDPAGGRIGRSANGAPDGLLWELAVNLVSDLIPPPEVSELDTAIASGIARLNSLGITAVHDQRMKDQHEGPMAFEAYQRLGRAGRLTLRVSSNFAAHDLPHLEALGLRSGFGNDSLRIGHLKLFADGTLGSQTAWMLEAFGSRQTAGADSYGINLTPPDEMATLIDRASSLGIPSSVHAIGDRAIRVVLDIFEEMAAVREQPSVPHRIEHVQLIHPADLLRLADLGLTASVQPIHILDDMDLADRLLGARASCAYRFRSLADSGALLALGSDAPVADPNPFLGIQGAVSRQRPERMNTGTWYPTERLTLEQAIEGYTLGPAKASGWQKLIGSISPGKLADMIVLDRDLFRLVEEGIEGSELSDTRVLITIFDGRILEQPPGTILE